MNKYKITITLEFSECNGYMDVLLNYVTKVIPNQDNRAIINLDIELPAQISLIFSNKHNDTIVDQLNNIIKDKSVQIKSIKLDSFELNDIFLQQKIQLKTEDQIITTSYIGFNGEVILDFNQNNAFKQVIACNSPLMEV